jgi:hypothetical protein
MEKKSNFLEKILGYEKLPKFEQHFELVSRIVTLKKHNVEKRKFSNYLFQQNNSVAMVTIALPIIENIPI